MLAALAAALLLAVPTSAQADSFAKLADGHLIDASSDGRYVLYSDASGRHVVDRTAGTITAVPAGAEQLADRSPRVLVDTGTGYAVLDLAAGTTTPATVDTTGATVSSDRAVLVRDGRDVIFSTGTGAATRILDRDLQAGTTRLRLSGYDLLDASEDDRVITWRRQLAPAQRPANTRPTTTDPAGGAAGQAVGYAVDGSAPRVLRRTQWREVDYGATPGTCQQRAYTITSEEFLSLQVQQDATNGRYAFLLATRNINPQIPHEQTTWSTIDATGDRAFLVGEQGYSYASSIVDPVSGAYSQVYGYADGVIRGHGILFPDDGHDRDVHIPGPGEQNDLNSAQSVIPTDRGASAIVESTNPAGTSEVHAFASGETNGPTQREWITAPRTTDTLDSPSLTPAAEWINCPNPGVFSDYVTFAPNPGRSRTVAVTMQYPPLGIIPQSYVRANVTWLGLTVWTRTFTKPGTFNTPALPQGLGGFDLRVWVYLDGGGVVAGSRTL